MVTYAPFGMNWWEGNQFRMPALPEVARPTYAQALSPVAANATGSTADALKAVGVPNPAEGGAGTGQAAPSGYPGGATQGSFADNVAIYAPNMFAASNPFGMAMGAGSALLGAAFGRNGSNTGILGALGLSPLGNPNVARNYADQYASAIGSALGQSLGSPSLDFFGGINDLSTVGQLGAVLDARDFDRATGGISPGNSLVGSPETGGRSADGAPGDITSGNYAGPNSPNADTLGDTGMYRRGGLIPHDGDRRMEAKVVTAHEGEYVVRPEAVKHYGKGLLGAINERKLDKKKLKGLLG